MDSLLTLEGNLLLLLHWVTTSGKWSESEPLGSLKNSHRISIWANRLPIYLILNTYINHNTRWLHFCFAAVLKLLHLHVKRVAISLVWLISLLCATKLIFGYYLWYWTTLVEQFISIAFFIHFCMYPSSKVRTLSHFFNVR